MNVRGPAIGSAKNSGAMSIEKIPKLGRGTNRPWFSTIIVVVGLKGPPGNNGPMNKKLGRKFGDPVHHWGRKFKNVRSPLLSNCCADPVPAQGGTISTSARNGAVAEATSRPTNAIRRRTDRRNETCMGNLEPRDATQVTALRAVRQLFKRLSCKPKFPNPDGGARLPALVAKPPPCEGIGRNRRGDSSL